ncbi:hypothetical protein [Lysobacter humi (ex Lee et al. 2017)]
MIAVPPPASPDRRRNRLKLLAIVAVFLVPMIVAGILRFADIHPAASRQKGELLQPPADLRAAHLRTTDGAAYDWKPVERRWRILVAPPAVCADECIRTAGDVAKVWSALGRESHRVDVLWWCGAEPCGWPAQHERPQTLLLIAPDPLRARLPGVAGFEGVPVYVVDPNGFVVLRYAPGSDLGGLRSDLSKLLKLR